MMNKKNILTAGGIILSFVIAVGGWALTSNFIEIKSNKLLSKTLSVATNTLDNISADIPSETPDNTNENNLLAQPTMSEDDIVSILNNWGSAGRETPHEPTEEQLNMEQAIETGQKWLSFIGGLNIFPDELLHFNNPRAYLFQNLSLGQGGKFLPPTYSYWKVAFTNESMSVNIVINAVTGTVWKTDIDIFVANINISDYDITNALTAFVSDLEINPDKSGEIITDGLTISSIQDGDKNKIIGEMNNVEITVTAKKELKSLMDSYDFANGNANAVVMATGWQSEDGRWSINNFSMHLLDKD